MEAECVWHVCVFALSPHSSCWVYTSFSEIFFALSLYPIIIGSVSEGGSSGIENWGSVKKKNTQSRHMLVSQSKASAVLPFITFWDVDSKVCIICSQTIMVEFGTEVSLVHATKLIFSYSFDMVPGGSVSALKVKGICCKIHLQRGSFSLNWLFKGNILLAASSLITW